MTIMRLGALVCLLLAACATQAPEDDKNAAIQHLVECMFREAKHLDDGTSDPASIAIAVVEGCSVEEQRVITVEAQGYNYAMRARFEPQWKAKDRQLATMIVLKTRAGETNYQP